jgi:hypothetical protein
VYYEKPLVKLDRILNALRRVAPGGWAASRRALPVWASHRIDIPGQLEQGLGTDFRGTMGFAEHHKSHRGQRVLPFAVRYRRHLDLDAVGEWATSSNRCGQALTDRDPGGDEVPAFHWAAVLRVHRLRRVQGELRGVQAHGLGAVRRAASPIEYCKRSSSPRRRVTAARPVHPTWATPSAPTSGASLPNLVFGLAVAGTEEAGSAVTRRFREGL